MKDVDLAFFDPNDLSRQRDIEVEAALRRAHRSGWDAKNQAAVHTWYESRFGHPIDPISSLEDGIRRWLEPATAVAVRLEASDEMTVIAPLGLGASHPRSRLTLAGTPTETCAIDATTGSP